jgi:hypothetical protein
MSAWPDWSGETWLTKLILSLALLFWCSLAYAGSVIALRTYDDGTTIMFVASTSADYDGVTITNIVVPRAGTTVKSVQVQGNHLALATCSRDTCPYRWPRSAMRSGSNDVSLLVVLNNGAGYITTGTIGQPLKTITTIDPTIFPPPPTIEPQIAKACGGGYLLDDKGAHVLDGSGGALLAC